ncbi:PP2C family protein-serine/threonine phosphatase [Streptomyces sp. TLI_146]|uniref:PP2C family protein-serine/threonine phosphatase n=1 Tax=Streptomyces sp. TLI_146 TaxID=1938858 RepID=UPI000C7156FD|nr:PP2C family protein-serine/threonine phosphatase [Streptomyces sp. TLI_146]PKV85387.1 serine phosphatase RsbU (regulator of sigma subunit) [Streptomyces sp. TLI_146]
MADEGASGLLPVAPRPLWQRALPVVVLAGITAAQLGTPNGVELGYFLAAVPPLAAFAYGPIGTVVLATVTFVGVLLPHTRDWYPHPGDILTLAVVVVFSIVVAWVRQRRDHQLVTVRTVAEAAQLAVLPPLPDAVGPVRCAGLYQAAQRGTLVGGDFYDVREGPHGVRAVIADVQGHGLAAVGTVAALLGAFREAVLDEPTLAAVAARLDRRLVVDARPDGHGELFATALLLEFPPHERVVRVVSCGHPRPFLLRGRTAAELAAEPAPPLGLGLAGLAPPGELRVELADGDRILAYTDGVTEARDGAGAFYPLGERLAALATPRDGLAALTEAVRDDLVRYAGRAKDDVALLALALAPANGHRAA